VKEVLRLDADGTVKIMAYVQKNNPVPRTGCGRRRLSGMKNPFKSKELKSVSKELKKASNTHASQAEKIDKFLESSPNKMKSPMKGKLKPCQKAAAKRKFKVYPSAYANMWASNHKC
jgi:hypothetical protein